MIAYLLALAFYALSIYSSSHPCLTCELVCFATFLFPSLPLSLDDLGEAQSRVHLIDVDDPANKELVQFQGVTSFPTIVVVQGNNILGKANGYKDFDTVHDIAFVDTAGVPFDQSFPEA